MQRRDGVVGVEHDAAFRHGDARGGEQGLRLVLGQPRAMSGAAGRRRDADLGDAGAVAAGVAERLGDAEPGVQPGHRGNAVGQQAGRRGVGEQLGQRGGDDDRRLARGGCGAHGAEHDRPRGGGVLVHVGRLVVQHEHAPDRRVVAERDDERLQRLGLLPEQRGVVQRVAGGRRAGEQARQLVERRRRERRQRHAEVLRDVGRDARVAARAGHHGDARGAHGPALDGERLRQLEQLVRVACPRGPGLLDERPEDALIPRDGAGVGLRGGGARGRRAGLQQRDADTGARAALERLAPAPAVAVVLQVQRDRAHAVGLRERQQVVLGPEHGLVAAGDDGVQPQPAP